MPTKNDKRYAIIGGKHRAESRYYMILYRLSHTDEPKNYCYAGVKMTISKKDFIKWFMEHDFEGASVDRIDSTKDYSLDNIQIISLADNIRKDKLKAKDGYCECCRCKQVKPLDEFVKNNKCPNGRATICVECERKRTREKYHRLKKK